jgi:aspartyl aminopeptidase
MSTLINNAAQANNTVQSFLDFLKKSTSQYHAVYQCQQLLMQAGFQRLDERVSWESILKPGGKYFFQRAGATIVAFTLGRKYAPGQGLYIIGAHTDSPCLRIRPNPHRAKEGYNMIGVSLYGGGIWHTWFDRDLGVAGKIVMRNAHTQTLEEQLIQISTPILRIPSLAIHLDRDVNEQFKLHTENHLIPVLGLQPSQAMGSSFSTGVMELPSFSVASVTVSSSTSTTTFANTMPSNFEQREEPAQYNDASTPLFNLLYQAAGIPPNTSSSYSILGMDLSLYDLQPPSIGGANQEFIFSGKLDNLFMSWCALQALLQADTTYSEGAKVIALFDHEEVGSESNQGAGSDLLPSLLERLQLGNPSSLPISVGSSFIASADVAHAVHPNYADRHEDQHKPKINHGMVIKTNFQQRYATSAISTALFKQCVKLVTPSDIQEFVVRSDIRCGSTIGPILSSKTGIRTVDIGLPILSMHSIREMGGVHDLSHGIQVLRSFLDNFHTVDTQTICL